MLLYSLSALLIFAPMQPIICPIRNFPPNPPTTSPHPSFLLLCPLSLHLSPPFPKVTQLIAPYSHQLTPPAPPSSILPTSFGSSPCIPVSSTLFLPSFLHSTQPLPYPAPGYSLVWARCPVVPGDKWELSHSGFVLAAGSVGSGWHCKIPDEFLHSYSHLRWRWGGREGCWTRRKKVGRRKVPYCCIKDWEFGYIKWESYYVWRLEMYVLTSDIRQTAIITPAATDCVALWVVPSLNTF